MLGGDSWPPAFQFYDFLKIIDMQEDEPTDEEEVEAEEVNVEEHLVSKKMPGDIETKLHSEL